MVDFYTIDLFQILRLNKKGLFNITVNNKLGLIISAIIDLITLERLDLIENKKNNPIIVTNDYELTGNELLDEIYITIRECPKKYTLEEWLNRFNDSYPIYEQLSIDSLLRREIFNNEPRIKRFIRYLIFISFILCIPFIALAFFYFSASVKPIRYNLMDSNLQNQILNDLDEIIKSSKIPDPNMIGLIITLKTLSTNILNPKTQALLVKKFYQLQDYDFNNPSIKLLVDYFIGR